MYEKKMGKDLDKDYERAVFALQFAFLQPDLVELTNTFRHLHKMQLNSTQMQKVIARGR